MTKAGSQRNVPRMVRSHDVALDSDYADWIRDVKRRYRSAQVKAAAKVNSEQLLFNWELGRDLVARKAEERWGSGVVEQVSLDLQSVLMLDRILDDTTKLNAVQAFNRVEEKTGREVELRTV